MVRGRRKCAAFNSTPVSDFVLRISHTMDRTCARCRLSNQKLFLKGERCFTPKCPFTRRSYAPGIHGQSKKRGRPTEYGQQLREKQRVKWTYGVRERQFRNLYEEAIRKTGNTGEFMATFLEMRLDTILYRLGVGTSHAQARQIVGHNHVLVNGKRMNIPSYRCSVGDRIALRKDSSNNPLAVFKNFIESGPSKQKPEWIAWDSASMEATILRQPAHEELPTQFNMKAIIEFYSR